MKANKRTISLVLGSGGARGYAHIGVIEELEKSGYEIAFISGSSMGALIGALHACGKLEVYKEWVLGLDLLDVAKLVDVSFNKKYIRSYFYYKWHYYALYTRTRHYHDHHRYHSHRLPIQI